VHFSHAILSIVLLSAFVDTVSSSLSQLTQAVTLFSCSHFAQIASANDMGCDVVLHLSYKM